MSATQMSSTFKVRGTEIVATDTPQQYREKLARIALAKCINLSRSSLKRIRELNEISGQATPG